jgi:hypothetical protein
VFQREKGLFISSLYIRTQKEANRLLRFVRHSNARAILKLTIKKLEKEVVKEIRSPVSKAERDSTPRRPPASSFQKRGKKNG